MIESIQKLLNETFGQQNEIEKAINTPMVILLFGYLVSVTVRIGSNAYSRHTNRKLAQKALKSLPSILEQLSLMYLNMYKSVSGQPIEWIRYGFAESDILKEIGFKTLSTAFFSGFSIPKNCPWKTNIRTTAFTDMWSIVTTTSALHDQNFQYMTEHVDRQGKLEIERRTQTFTFENVLVGKVTTINRNDPIEGVFGAEMADIHGSWARTQNTHDPNIIHHHLISKILNSFPKYPHLPYLHEWKTKVQTIFDMHNNMENYEKSYEKFLLYNYMIFKRRHKRLEIHLKTLGIHTKKKSRKRSTFSKWANNAFNLFR